MIRLFTAILLLFTFLIPYTIQAQIQSPDSPYMDGYLKWDEGNYIGAIEDFLDILNGPDADLYFDDIAKLTGEIYKVDEISADGRDPVFSPDNIHFVWVDLTGDEQIIKIARVTDSETEHLHSVKGSALQFSPNGQHAIFFKTEITQ